MDMLITGIAIALLCLAAWLLYKRFCGRYKAPPPEYYDDDEVDDYENEVPAVQEAVAKPTPPEPEKAPPAPEPKKEA